MSSFKLKYEQLNAKIKRKISNNLFVQLFLFFPIQLSIYFLPCCTFTPSLGQKTTVFDCKYVRLRSEDSVEDALLPVLVLQQEDILDNGGQAGFREGTIQTGFQERRPFPLQCPLAAHIPLNTETEVTCWTADIPLKHNTQTRQREALLLNFLSMSL